MLKPTVTLTSRIAQLNVGSFLKNIWHKINQLPPSFIGYFFTLFQTKCTWSSSTRAFSVNKDDSRLNPISELRDFEQFKNEK